MPEPLIDGVIRKLWIDRAGPYRDHLLRLDAESRRNRLAARCRTSSSRTMPSSRAGSMP